MPGPDPTSSAETEFIEDLDRDVARAIAGHVATFTELGDDVLRFSSVAEQFVAGGKRFRASFVRAGWLVAGGVDRAEPMMQAAAAIELLQGSALVHDDLMDGSDTRRGRPSVHREFEARHREAGRVGDPADFGRSAAVLMGDLLLSISNQELVAAAGRIDPAARDRAIRLYDLCKVEVTAGQFLDVVAATHAEISVDDALKVATYKSAKYTVERPLQIGAALAGADDALLAGLSAVALPLGVAFQLRDDVLGVFGDPEVTGKPAGDDLREGKRTVLVARALEHADEGQRTALTQTLGTDDVDTARGVIEATGAREAVEADIARLEDESDAAIAALGPDAVAVLRPLALRATRRAR